MFLAVGHNPRRWSSSSSASTIHHSNTTPNIGIASGSINNSINNIHNNGPHGTNSSIFRGSRIMSTLPSSSTADGTTNNNNNNETSQPSSSASGVAVVGTGEAAAPPQEDPNSTSTARPRTNSSDNRMDVDNNPLMRLVDAALSPSHNNNESKEDATMKDTEGASPAAKEEDVSNKPSTAQPDTSSTTTNQDDKPQAAATAASNTTTTATSSPLPQQQEDDSGPTVLKGSVHDLVASQSGTGEKKTTFAEYLLQVLENPANHDVLQWMPCGTQFTVVNHRKFTAQRMPELFQIRNMSSFVRKLTRWGFSRVHCKESGNSDIFRHPLFRKDQPELCRKIRCVNRATASNSLGNNMAMTHGMYHHPHQGMGRGGGFNPHGMMGSLSESSSSSSRHHHPMELQQQQHLMSSPPQRGRPGYGSAHYPSPSPPHRGYGPRGPTPGYAGGHRVSPEYEKELMSSNAFRPQRAPGPPQVYSPSSSQTFGGGGLTAAAEYELEQILLQRQQARAAAAYRAQQQQQGASSQQQRTSPPSQGIPMGSGSERSSLGSGSEQASRGGGAGRSSEAAPVPPPTDSTMAAALETLQRDMAGGGAAAAADFDYEHLDMSPREAMLRAVLHKRQQQRAAAARLQSQQRPPYHTDAAGPYYPHQPPPPHR